MIPLNSVGLCRKFVAEVKSDLSDCPRACTHKEESDCRKFMWTIVNKDGFELALWQDSKLIGSYCNFFSGIRAGELARGAHAQKKSYEVWVPESPHHFNIEGRSATDASDQDRKKLTMAERRITRAGHKGIAFVFDVAFSNGHAMWLELAPAGISAAKRSK